MTFFYSQTKQYLTLKEFVPNVNEQIKCDKIIKTLSGENEEVNTKLFVGKSKSTKTNVALFNKMIDVLLFEARLNLKNKSSFKAQYIRIYEDDSIWTTYIDYSGANDYGARKDSQLSIKFDNDLKVLDKFSPY